MTGAVGAEPSRAVLIGTARYTHLAAIPAATANVTDLADVLTRPGAAFTTGQCVTVLDPDRTGVGNEVGRAARGASGLLLVYYTGHGLLDRRGRLHLAVPGSDPADVRWTAVPFETLREEILDSPARVRVLILDCCFAGRAFEAMADVPSLVAGQTDIHGTYTITSSSANEPSFAPADHRNTAFTGAFLAVAAAAPASTLDELYRETDRHLHLAGHPRPQCRNIDIAADLRLFGQPQPPTTPAATMPGAGRDDTPAPPAPITPAVSPGGPASGDHPHHSPALEPIEDREPGRPAPDVRRRIGRRRVLTGAAIAIPLTAATAAGITALRSPTTPNRLAGTSASPSAPAQLAWTTAAVLTGHTGKVYSVAFNPAGTLLATGSSDKTARLWDVTSRQLVGQPLTGHTGDVESVAFNPAGTLLATGSYDQTVRLWDVASRELVGQPLGHTNGVVSVAFNPAGTLLATGSYDQTVRLWDVASRELVGQPLGHTSWVLSVAFNRDGTLLATGSSDQTVRLWDVASRELIGQPLTGHTNEVVSVAFNPTGTLLATGSYDMTVRLWDVASRELVGQPLGHTDLVWSVAFNPAGTLLATGSLDKTRLWDVASRQLVGQPLTGHTDGVLSVAFDPAGTLLATGSFDTTVRLWK
ncbi:caspase, EACC1-associated type [Nocardia sp. CA-119907]|uniref:caspase, EACC1-associated type n=1 Tax=Nocardia sp. CA-119907 TaxID=3239973 RepID=UPI003D953757